VYHIFDKACSTGYLPHPKPSISYRTPAIVVVDRDHKSELLHDTALTRLACSLPLLEGKLVLYSSSRIISGLPKIHRKQDEAML
jgi:hypothetical protein